MNDSAFLNSNRYHLVAPAVNGQLARAVLSPVSEHGLGTQDIDGGTGSSSTGPKEGDTTHVHAVENSGRISSGRRESSFELHNSPRSHNGDSTQAVKLPPQQIYDVLSSPESLLLHLVPSIGEDIVTLDSEEAEASAENGEERGPVSDARDNGNHSKSERLVSTPTMHGKESSSKSFKAKPKLTPLQTGDGHSPQKQDDLASPMPARMPMPPMSLPTYLQLELSSDRPSALYLHRSANADFPYESSKVKFERLLSFLLLPPNLEQVLWFGAIACVDAWLYTFTILPLRFLKALAILAQWWVRSTAQEVLDLGNFVHGGVGRVYRRRRQSSLSDSSRPSVVEIEFHSNRASPTANLTSGAGSRMNSHIASPSQARQCRKSSSGIRHRHPRSEPSALLPNHKADILHGLLIICSCYILMWFDASRMYHSIRGQSAIKLYVIYNVLEVFDRLFAALGQDILECLFSKETLERDVHGRSKVIRPLWMFLLALVYNVIHATALFYQVVTLNVAVNSYSNALLTLLTSNQFVEIKGTVFKKFEKENLFQLTCADVVERFQLWLMLLIIALRNVVEVGGLSISLNNAFGGTATENVAANATGLLLTSGFAIPHAFTVLSKWTGEVLSPFLIVLGSEALVDWCKHAYIIKFNNTKPNIYGQFLDVLAKDYYTHAFADQNLTKRLGLPVIPLSSLFIRASMQTYHMFLATHVPLPIPPAGTAVSVGSEAAAATSPATIAALQHIDHVFRRALGRSSFGAGHSGTPIAWRWWWSFDDLIAFATMFTFFLALYFILLACKLILGMLLLSYSRSRYVGMKERERQDTDTRGRRRGGWGVVEVDEEKRRWIYTDDAEGLRQLREREERGRKRGDEKGDQLHLVDRYTMAAKRIW